MKYEDGKVVCTFAKDQILLEECLAKLSPKEKQLAIDVLNISEGLVVENTKRDMVYYLADKSFDEVSHRQTVLDCKYLIQLEEKFAPFASSWKVVKA